MVVAGREDAHVRAKLNISGTWRRLWMVLSDAQFPTKPTPGELERGRTPSPGVAVGLPSARTVGTISAHRLSIVTWRRVENRRFGAVLLRLRGYSRERSDIDTGVSRHHVHHTGPHRNHFGGAQVSGRCLHRTEQSEA